MLALLVVMLYRSLRREGEHDEASREGELDRALGIPQSRRMITLFLVLGAVGLPLGAYLMVDGAVQAAEALGVTEGVIGLSVVAFGTSLPELATTMAAALRRHADVAIGNVLGSNLFNILAIMGIVAVVTPEPIVVPQAFLRFDLIVLLGSSVLLTVLAFRGGAVSRGIGVCFVAAYVAYLIALFASAPHRGTMAAIVAGS
jgi:cation:H+ antiporter